MNITYEYESEFTHIPNSFIDRFMGKANPNYICVYILTLRYISANEPLSTRSIAERLDIMESDVMKAYEYWHTNNVMEITKTENECRISICNSNNEEKFSKNKPEYTADEIAHLMETDEKIRELLSMAERTFAKTFDIKWKNVMIRLYKYYKLPTEVISILFEYCIENDKRKADYIEKTALDWANNRIKTEEQAVQHIKDFLSQKRCKKIMYFFGKKTDGFVEDEDKTMINKWFTVYKFDDIILREACQRTLKKIHTIRISYTDKMLTEWYEAKAKTLQDIELLDEQFKNSQQKKGKNVKIKSSSFSNFEQRNYDDMDFADIENEIINSYRNTSNDKKSLEDEILNS